MCKEYRYSVLKWNIVDYAVLRWHLWCCKCKMMRNTTASLAWPAHRNTGNHAELDLQGDVSLVVGSSMNDRRRLITTEFSILPSKLGKIGGKISIPSAEFQVVDWHAVGWSFTTLFRSYIQTTEELLSAHGWLYKSQTKKAPSHSR